MRQLGNFCSAWINDSQGGSIAEGLFNLDADYRVTFSGVCSCCENKVCIGNFSYAVGHSTASKGCRQTGDSGSVSETGAVVDTVGTEHRPGEFVHEIVFFVCATG